MYNPQEQGSSTQQKAQDAASKVTDQLRDTTSDVTDKARETARTTAENQKGRVAESVGTVADALRQTGHQLDDQNQGQMAHFAHMAADRLEQFSDDLQNKSVEEIIGDVEDFARRDPQLFLGGALLLGLFASRFFKSSARRSQQYDWQGDYRQRGYQSGPYGQRGAYMPARSTQYRTRYSGSQSYGSAGPDRTFDESDLSDYRRDVMDDFNTGTGDYSATTGQTSTSGHARPTGTPGQRAYGTGMGMGETSENDFRTSSTDPGMTDQDFSSPPSNKPGSSQNPSKPDRTNE